VNDNPLKIPIMTLIAIKNPIPYLQTNGVSIARIPVTKMPMLKI
jgi:hypothetical protein